MGKWVRLVKPIFYGKLSSFVWAMFIALAERSSYCRETLEKYLNSSMKNLTNSSKSSYASSRIVSFCGGKIGAFPNF
jgi:hypothetical protein